MLTGYMEREATLNKLYISIGSMIVVALFTALLAPFFIDWTDYRAVFEREAERLLGRPVRVLGDADLRILPIPRFAFQSVQVGALEGRPDLTAESLTLDVALMPLLKGEVKILSAVLNKPVVRLAVDKDGLLIDQAGELHPDRLPLDKSKVSLERLDIRDGIFIYRDQASASSIRLDAFNGSLTARSLLGPYKLEGGFRFGQTPFTLSVGTGKAQKNGAMQARMFLTPGSLPVTLTTDGTLSFSDSTPSYKAALRLVEVKAEQKKAVAWSLEGQVDLTTKALGLSDMALKSTGEGAHSFAGRAKVTFGADRRFDLALKTKRLDLDRLFQLAGERRGFSAIFNRLMLLAKTVPTPDMNGQILLDAEGVVLAGEVVRTLSLAAVPAPNGWSIKTLQAILPGDSQLETSGILELGDPQRYAGALRLATARPSALAGWWSGRRKAVKDGGTFMPRALVPAFDFSTKLDIRRDYVALDDVMLGLGETGLAGHVLWKQTLGLRGQVDGKGAVKAPARTAQSLKVPSDLTASLTGRSVNVDDVLAAWDLFFGAPKQAFSALGSDAVSLSLKMDKAHFSGADIDNVDAAIVLSGNRLTIDNLNIGNLGGIRVGGTGEIVDLFGAPDGRLDMRVSADDLGGIAAMAEKLGWQHPAFLYLKNHQTALTPLDLKVGLIADRQAEVSDLVLTTKGVAGPSRLTLDGAYKGRMDAFRKGLLRVEGAVSADDGLQLVALAGWKPLFLTPPGAGLLKISGKGALATGISGALEAKLGSMALQSKGTLRLAAGKAGFAGLSYAGRSQIASEIASDLWLLGGLVAPQAAGAAAINAAFDTELTQNALAMKGLKGRYGTADVQGSLNVARVHSGTKLTGTLAVSEMDGRLLLAALLGPGVIAPDNADAVWSGQAFKPQPFGTFQADVGLTVPVLQISDAEALRAVSLVVSLRPNQILLDQIIAQYAGGRLQGRLKGVTKADLMQLSGSLRADDLKLEELVWARNGRAIAEGQLTGALDVEGAGRTPAGLVSSLNGGGLLTLESGVLRGINPNAFRAVVQAADKNLPLENAAVSRVLTRYLDAGVMAVKKAEMPFSLSAGILRARNIRLPSEQVSLIGGGRIDLTKMVLDSAWTLDIDPGREAVAGASPSLGLSFKGVLQTPRRLLDVSALTGYLSVRKFEQDVRRVEALQADILEKERLLRELRLVTEAKKAREQAEKEQQQQDKAKKDKDAAAKADALKRAREAEARKQAEAARQAAEKAAREKAEREKAAREAAEKQRQAAIKAEQARKAAAKKAAAEKAAVEKAAAEKAAAERAAKAAAAKRNDAAGEKDALQQARDVLGVGAGGAGQSGNGQMKRKAGPGNGAGVGTTGLNGARTKDGQTPAKPANTGQNGQGNGRTNGQTNGPVTSPASGSALPGVTTQNDDLLIMQPVQPAPINLVPRPAKTGSPSAVTRTQPKTQPKPTRPRPRLLMPDSDR